MLKSADQKIFKIFENRSEEQKFSKSLQNRMKLNKKLPAKPDMEWESRVVLFAARKSANPPRYKLPHLKGL